MQSLFEAYEPDQELLQQTQERCETEITQLNIKLGQFNHRGCGKAQHFGIEICLLTM